MAVLNFQDLEFVEEKDRIKAYFLRIYYFYISKKELARIADFKLKPHSIEFECSEKKAANKFSQLLQKGFEKLVCSVDKKKTVYVHKNSGIPLIGSGMFGLIDRNTSCIEVKPLTACNLNCVFCSVDSGLETRKSTGYVVEKDYLIEEFNRLADKKEHPIEAHIGPQGEPLLYAPLAGLVKELKSHPKVRIVSMDTNATLLSKKLIDELAGAGMDRFNISLNALNPELCTRMAGAGYNLQHVLKMIKYAAKKTGVLLAPVVVPGMNEQEMKNIIELGKEIQGLGKVNQRNTSKKPFFGLQNYLNYKRGRNPVKQKSWDAFFEFLKQLEKEHKVRLSLSSEDFFIKKDAVLEKPFKKNNIIKAKVVCQGPYKGELIAAYKNRAIIVSRAGKGNAAPAVNSEIKLRIIRDKHNVYRAVSA